MRLDKIRLQNFRCFQSLEMTFHSNVTVIVAENGQGKTTILDAIRIGLWPFLNGFDLASSGVNDASNSIAIDDVRAFKLENMSMARGLPVEVELTGNWQGGDNETPWLRFRDSEKPRSKTKDNAQVRLMQEWATKIQNEIRNPDASAVSLPMLGYYGTGRLWNEKKLTAKKAAKKDTSDTRDFYIRTFAYRDCMDPASSYKHFKDWFMWASTSWMEYLFKNKDEHGIAAIPTYLTDPIRAVTLAIDDVLKEPTGWHGLEYSYQDEKSLVLRHAEYGTLKVEQLSDGIRNMLAMVGDIAYRCAKLNPHFGIEAARRTKGVVLIDEVDMHLHPRWQQLVLGQLTKAFPNIQFIVTTHSPQVLTTVDNTSIRILRQRDEVGMPTTEVITPSLQTKGVASSDVLANIMLIDPVPHVAEAEALSRYRQLIETDQLTDNQEAHQLRDRLLAHFGQSHPVMQECERLIRLQAIKKRLPPAPQPEKGRAADA